jgi:DNA-binding winged helix-turn-helix (wHTH) protein
VIRSGVYEIDLDAGELRRNGLKIPLQDQPFKVMARLLDQPGALVTREALQTELWGSDPLVDADLGLNTAIKKLRVAFRDSADNPRFIETVPKRGYRFIAPVREGHAELLPRLTTAPVLDNAGSLEPGGSDDARAQDALVLEPLEPAEGGGRPAMGTDREVAMSRSPGAPVSWRKRLLWICACLLILGAAGLLAASITMIGRSSSIARPAGPGIVKVYDPDGKLGRSDGGIGGFDLKSAQDRAFALDFDHSGKLDHLVFYRPGTSHIWILRNSLGRFGPVYEGGGVGNYGLTFHGADQVFAFDYDHRGKPDHLVIYRRGAGLLRIFKNEGHGLFTPVYQAASDERAAPADAPPVLADQVIPFDYDHSGKADHLLFYRSGGGILGVWTNFGGKLSQLSVQGVAGLGRLPAGSGAEQAFAFDYDHSGKPDHLAVYRPGDGAVSILRNQGGAFSPVYQGPGLGGYDLKSPSDRMIGFDYDASGKLDHLLIYRPGAGVASILENANGTFRQLYQGQGFAGYDLMSVDDRALAFDFGGSGKLDHLVFYRPGTGIARIVQLR